MTTINNIEDLIRVLGDNPEWAEALRLRLLTRELIALPEVFSQFVTQNGQVFERSVAALEALQRDLTPLKDASARRVARREAPLIAEDLGFELVRVLRVQEIGELVRGKDTSGVLASTLKSFRQADIMMEARDHEGSVCYIAVEVSFTVTGRDTGRATRNAGYLIRFTGLPAVAVVAGLYHDEQIKPSIESGEVFWYQLDSKRFELE